MLSPRCRGFALPELLVVCVTIAILISTLYPVFARAREQARKSQCQSNLKQIGTATLMYAQDYDEILPSPWPEWGQGKFDWDHTFHVSLYPYLKNSGVFACPSMDPRTYRAQLPWESAGVESQGLAMAYMMNETGWSDGPGPHSVREGLPMAVVEAPADYILVTEAMGVDDPEGYSWQDAQIGATDEEHAAWGGSPKPRPDTVIEWSSIYNAPGSDWGRAGVRLRMSPRHLDGNSIAFADGHVKWMRSTRGQNWLVAPNSQVSTSGAPIIPTWATSGRLP